MGLTKLLFKLAISVCIAAVFYSFLFGQDHKLPEIEEKWFGKNKLKAGELLPEDPVAVKPFTVNVSDEVLHDLKRRLESTRFVEPISGTQFNYGFNSDYLRQIVDYWRTGYNWRKEELVLNKFNHFKTQINGINIHYIHVKPSNKVKTVVPLLMIHGWPSSVWEFYKAIPLLIESKNDIAFEVICPSIPGFGFSDAPQQKGFDVTQTAQVFVKLMDRLDHKKFFVHGGDWGSFIARAMALFYTENIRGMHTTFNAPLNYKGMALIKYILGMFFPSLVFKNPEQDYKKIYPIVNKLQYSLSETGYFHIQATKPDTIGAALTDSPVGMAAYILDRYSMGTDPKNLNQSDGGLTEKFTLDELLTNVMIYWTSNNIASSMRYYKESFVKLMTMDINDMKIPVSVPAAVADFPNEMMRCPRELVEYIFGNLVQHTEMPKGGHFSAMEEPKLLSDDIKSFIKIVLDNGNK